MYYPAWVQTGDVAKNKVRFLIKLAGVHHNSRGSLKELAEDLGVHYYTLQTSHQRGWISREVALLLEGYFGAETFPRYELCPESFPTPVVKI